jgi:CRP-like cAMP-binding protein
MLPWLVPTLEPQFQNVFLKHGERLSFSKGSILTSENMVSESFYLVRSGLLSNSVIDFMWKKQEIICNICLPGSISGDGKFAVEQPTPIRITALQRSEVYRLNYTEISKYLHNYETNKILAFQVHISRCMKCVCDTLFILISFQAEERIKCLFASIIIAFDTNINYKYVKIPIRITRFAICKATHISMMSLDRIFGKWMKQGSLRRDGACYIIETSMIRDFIDWIMGHAQLSKN